MHVCTQTLHDTTHAHTHIICAPLLPLISFRTLYYTHARTQTLSHIENIIYRINAVLRFVCECECATPSRFALCIRSIVYVCINIHNMRSTRLRHSPESQRTYTNMLAWHAPRTARNSRIRDCCVNTRLARALRERRLADAEIDGDELCAFGTQCLMCCSLRIDTIV